MAVDRTRYNFNEKERLTKKALIFEVVKKYILDSNRTLDELKNTFSEKSDFNIDMFVTESIYQDFNDDRMRRYFDEPFELNDGTKVFLSTQWGGEIFKRLLKKIRTDLNYDVQEYMKVVNVLVNDTNKIKNIILYGSPGVGKTYNTKKLINLIESRKSEKEIFKIIKNNELNNGIDIDAIKDRVKLITFHQSFGYEDFIEGFRPNEEGNIQLEKGIFLKVCKEAQNNLDDSKKTSSSLHKEYSLKNKLDAFIEHLGENTQLTDEVHISNIDNKAFYYTSNSGGMVNAKISFNDILECALSDIQSLHDIKNLTNISGTSRQRPTYVNKIYQLFKQFKAENIVSEQQVIEVQEKNYYLVIDEINRGNISKIFGELITLIEEDKRDTLEVTLPYSKKPFKIPSNLYIIGTMNSTDKSIALIDIALRRRFTFLKMEPKLDLVNYFEAKELMRKLNEKISSTLGKDYQLGHSYFMNIENDDDLEFVLEYKIEPLLEEYFYGDEQGLKSVMEIVGYDGDDDTE